MPIYEYQCEDCGHKLEVMQRMSEDPIKTCPSCTKDALRKLISAVGFQLKGTGWYETDFKHKGKPKAGNGSDKGDGKSDAKDGASKGGGESKGDSAPDSKKSDSAKSTGTAAPTSSD